MKELAKSKKYIYGNVFFQWIKLITNVVIIFQIGFLLQDTITQTFERSLLHTLVICGAMIGIRFGASIGANRMSFRAIGYVKMFLRDKLYEKILKLGSSYHDKVATAEVVQLAVEGVEQLEVYVGRYLPQFYYSMLAPLTLFVIISTFSFKSAIILLICVPLIPMAIIAFNKLAKKVMSTYWSIYTEVGDTFLENLQGLTTLKIYETDGLKHVEMNKAAEKFRVITMKLLVMQLNSLTINNIIAFGGAAIAIIVAALQYTQGAIQFWQAFVIIILGSEFFIPLRILGSYFHVAMNGTTASEKLFRILDMEEPVRVQAKKQKEPKYAETMIALENVSFSYTKDTPVLKDISLQVKKGELVSLMGQSGCGKSTIAALLMGYLKDFEGKVYIDGYDSRSLTEKEIMKKVTLVSHDSYIFKGTVRENLLMGKPDATDAELLEALAKVKLKDFILAEGGLDFQIMEQGGNLSGGQKQRLAMARAFLHNSDIYIFDEATSNIDVESENYIMDFVHSIKGDKTVILISHRLANVVNSDRIYVLDKGRIVESGKHIKLVNNHSIYSQMYQQQTELEMYRGGVIDEEENKIIV